MPRPTRPRPDRHAYGRHRGQVRRPLLSPRCIGLSQPGSCPIQTPFGTSAITGQPVAQCVHTDFTILMAPVAVEAASACLTIPSGTDAAAMPPAASPERFRKERRSMALPAMLAIAFDKRGLPAAPFVLFVSIDLSP